MNFPKVKKKIDMENCPCKSKKLRKIKVPSISLRVSSVCIEILKKVLGGFDNIFHVYLMRGFQKYGKNSILTVAFCRQTKAGQKFAARWAELTVLFCR